MTFAWNIRLYPGHLTFQFLISLMIPRGPIVPSLPNLKPPYPLRQRLLPAFTAALIIC